MSRFRHAALALAGLLLIAGCQDRQNPTAPGGSANRDVSYELPDGQVIAIGSGTSIELLSDASTHHGMCERDDFISIIAGPCDIVDVDPGAVEGTRLISAVVDRRLAVDSIWTEFVVPDEATDGHITINGWFNGRPFGCSTCSWPGGSPLRVRLNGTEIGTVDFHFATFDATGVRPGRNRLTFVGSYYLSYRATVTWTVRDNSPPSITEHVDGTLGANSWYTGDASLTWDVTDAQSAVGSKSGCDAVSVTANTDGQTFTCEATSDGGTSSKSVTIKRDDSAPVISFGGPTSYTVDQELGVTCGATDPTSGITEKTCPTASGPAYAVALGAHKLEASATNGAGLASTATRTYTVSVTAASLSALVSSWVSNSGVANSLTKKLEHGQTGAFISEVSAQSGKKIPADQAAILIQLARKL